MTPPRRPSLAALAERATRNGRSRRAVRLRDDLAIRTADEKSRERRAEIAELPAYRVVVDTFSVWRAAWAVVGVVALAFFLRFVLSDGADVLFLVVMAFFLAIAMEPAVGRLARFMPRGLATALVMLLAAGAVMGFTMAFGPMLRDQVVQLVTALPAAFTSLVDWVNTTFHTQLSRDSILAQANLDTAAVAGYATTLAGGLLNILSSLAGAALSTFVFLFLTFYLSADAPRLRAWIAGLFPPRQQVLVLTAWELVVTKVGGYVGARLVLAALNGGSTAAFLWFIGMDYWLPLGIFTGLTAQFVPTVGTYIAIALPALIGFAGPQPTKGFWILGWAIAYQQVENLTFEPRISAKAVDVHPAVSFTSAMLGASLFGVAGALLGVPLAAALIALFDIYKQRYALSDRAEAVAVAAAHQEPAPAEVDEGEIEATPEAVPGDSALARTVARGLAAEDPHGSSVTEKP